MRRSGQVLIACAVLVGLCFFFLAPVFYWFTTPNNPPFSVTTTVYRSAGCAILGYGVLYFPNGDGYYTMTNIRGFWLGCSLPSHGGDVI